MTTKGILFDFDGTLVPNLDLADMRLQIAAMAQDAGVPEQVYADMYIVEIIHASHTWLSTRQPRGSTMADDYAAASHRRISDIEMAAARETELFDQVRPVLSKLRQAGYRLGIVTRNCREAVLTMFPDLSQFIDALHARDDVTFLKPDPRHLEANLRALNVLAKDAVMVGDGALDMQAGHELNMQCLGVLTGSNNARVLEEAGADQVLADYRSLVALLISPEQSLTLNQ